MFRLFNLIILAALAQPAAALTFFTEYNPPMNFMAGDGKVSGWATEVVAEVARRAGVTAGMTLLAWDDAYGRVQKDPEACVYSTARRPERFKLFQWVGPIGRGRYSAFALEGFSQKLAKVDDMKALRVGVVDDARAAYLRQRGFPTLVVAPADTQIPARLTLDPARADGIDIWITRPEGAAIIARQAGVNAIKEVFSDILSQDYWLACNLQMSPDITRALQGAVQEMQKDGSLRKLGDSTRFLTQ